MTPSPTSLGGEMQQATTPSKTVRVNITEPDQDDAHFLEVSECVETKTVTTTTRLTRKFPHSFDGAPTPLEELDAREYPLAKKPTPPELLSFNITTEQRPSVSFIKQDEDQNRLRQIKDVSPDDTPMDTANPSQHDLTDSKRASRGSSRSPSETYPRRSRTAKSGGLFTTATEPSIKPRDRNSHANVVASKLRRTLARGGSQASDSGSNCRDASQRSASACLATPEASERVERGQDHELASRPRVSLQRTQNIQDPSPSLAARNRQTSPAGSDTQTVFGSNVATPPITDADVEPFSTDNLPSFAARSVLHQPRPSIDVVAAQDASLPSPRLSPTLAAAQSHSNLHDEDNGESSFQTATSGLSGWVDDGQDMDANAMALSLIGAETSDSRALARRQSTPGDNSQSMDAQRLLAAFDSMMPDMQAYMMYQFLRRCARPTLRVVANAVNPALKCDFFSELPLELSYHILSYLDHRDLCRAAQVSKHWRTIVDMNETGWKELFDRDGFVLPAGELAKAIAQGWGWQDPVGATGFEKDLSMINRLKSSEQELIRPLRNETTPKTRTSKRKRGLITYGSERTKRRASAQEAQFRDSKADVEVKQNKSAGPLSAAMAATTSVPDPHLGLPSLRQLHLFKSLYRRHYMIRQSWTSGKVKPAHVAFAAHPRHVITCLQFDEDKIITGSDDTFIHVYDTKTGKLRNKLTGHDGGVWALQYEGNILVSGSTDRSVRVWDIEKGICQQVFYGHTSTVRCLQILQPTQTGTSPNGRPIMQPEKPLIITGSRDSQLRVWRLPEIGNKRYAPTGQPSSEAECPYFIRALHGHTHSVRAISAHGDTLVSGSYDSVVRVWRISTGECLHVLHGHSQKVYSVVLDHERNRCISGSMDSLVKIWDLNTGTCLYTLEGHSLLVGLLDLRDERLVSAAADSTLRIWDPENGRCKNTLMAHTGAITCFQHDGSKVISGSEKTVKMWDISSGDCVQDLLTDLSGVWQVKFDGRRCVAAVQRDSLTYVEILDFGAVRDGQPPEELGRRILLNEDEVQAMIEEEP